MYRIFFKLVTTLFDSLCLKALLDDGGDDIDNEAEILMWIKDFLTNELGKLGVNVPMLLMNNIRSLGSDELVLQVRYLKMY